MHIVGVDMRGPMLEQEMAAIAREQGVKTIPIAANLGDEAAIVALVARAKQELGRIDVLVNNAGIRETATVWETTTEMWDRMHNANLKGHFLITREVLKQDMLERNEGTLIFVSSGSGKKGEEDSSAYCASKWGVIGFAESVAKDLKKTRIRATSITPGMILTPMAKEWDGWRTVEWLDPAHVSHGIVFCVKQDADTIIPEYRVYHRSQV
jgi:NAD(P)-dependent dehydrogenase (short-subunit alcohol dehydrogenase family)